MLSVVWCSAGIVQSPASLKTAVAVAGHEIEESGEKEPKSKLLKCSAELMSG